MSFNITIFCFNSYLLAFGHKLTTYFNCEFVVAPARRLKHDDRVMIISKNKAHIGHRAH